MHGLRKRQGAWEGRISGLVFAGFRVRSVGCGGKLVQMRRLRLGLLPNDRGTERWLPFGVGGGRGGARFVLSQPPLSPGLLAEAVPLPRTWPKERLGKGRGGAGGLARADRLPTPGCNRTGAPALTAPPLPESHPRHGHPRRATRVSPSCGRAAPRLSPPPPLRRLRRARPPAGCIIIATINMRDMHPAGGGSGKAAGAAGQPTWHPAPRRRRPPRRRPRVTRGSRRPATAASLVTRIGDGRRA
eukprot:352115-Chlamydomonas_euryale.AAC.8